MAAFLLIVSLMNLTVEKFMTPLPHTIRHDQSLEVAHSLMRKHGIRHLPVLKDGRLAGIVSQRDLYMIETLQATDMTKVAVDEAMTTDTYTVGPRTSVRKVAEEMALNRYGSVVVMDGNQVVGIFTTTDALEALHSVLSLMQQPPAAPRNAERRR